MLGNLLPRCGTALLPKCVLILLAACLSQPARAEGSDRWWAQDKALHFGLSLTFPTVGYVAGSTLFDDGQRGLWVGATVGLTAGVAKELYDLTGRGTPSLRDLAWDGLGTATAVALTWVIDRLFFAHHRALREPRRVERPAAAPRAPSPSGGRAGLELPVNAGTE